MRLKDSLAAVLLLAAIPALPGCSDAGANKTQAQVVAVVNGEGINLHRLGRAQLGARTGGPTDEAESLRALEDAIDQELLVQRALRAGLDRNPEVALEVERATRRILARAYLRQVTSGISASTPEEVRQFYNANPALFAERRVYWLQEVRARLTREQAAALEARAPTARRLKDIARWLQAQRIAFDVEVSTRAAEQLPLAMLHQLSGTKDGEVAVFVSSGGVSAIELVQSQAAPLTQTRAAPLIQRYLANGKRLQRAEAEIGKLRKEARIKYAVESDRMRAQAPVAATDPHAGEALARNALERAVSGL